MVCAVIKIMMLIFIDGHEKIFNIEYVRGLPWWFDGSVVKNLPANAGYMGRIPGPGRSHMLRDN